MNQSKVFELYERLYFHEVDAKEKIAARMQIPLAILLSITSIYALFLKGADFSNISAWNIAFFVVLLISLLLHATSTSYFIRAFYGHTYEFIPSAIVSEKYRQELISTYKDFDDCDNLVEKHFKNYLFKYYSECASQNTNVNDNRSGMLHKCNTFFVLNFIPLIIAFFIFTFAGIDKNSSEKSYKVVVDKPVEFLLSESGLDQIKKKVNIMTEPTRPTPPPPPPKRMITEDFKVPSKPTTPPKNTPPKGN